MISVLAFMVAALGILLLAMLYGALTTASRDAKLAKHRSTQPSLPDLLNYAAVVDDGVVVGKNGAFMAGWMYKADDNASETEAQREMVALRINQAFARLGSGWMIHVDAVRRAAPDYPAPGVSAFPDAITAALDEERRRLFEGLGTMYEGYFVLTVTYFPPMLAQAKFVELMFDDDNKAATNTERTRGLIEGFKREVAAIESRLSAAVGLRRLRGHQVALENGAVSTHDDLLRWLHFCVTGKNHPVVLPSNPMYLDSVIGAQEMWGGTVPRIGGKFIQVVALEGFPLESAPGMLNALSELPCEYRWSSRFIFMDQHEAVKHMEKFRKKWKQKVRGFFDQVFQTNSSAVDQDAVSMVADAEAAIAEVNSGLVAQGYYTGVVVLMDENRGKLDAAARQCEKAINALGFNARIETINTMDAFFGSLPGHGVENVRRPLMNTLNMADLLPTSTIWTGNEKAPCPQYPPMAPALMHCVTSGATPFRLNLHVRDLGHALMFGPTRAGKSTHLGMLAAQFRRYRGMCVYAFDKGGSMYPLAAAIRAATKGTSGKHFDVGADSGKVAFCPLKYIDTKGDRAWAMEWIDTCCALNGLKTTAEQRTEIGRAITEMYNSKSRTFSEFLVTVQDNTIRAALRDYTIDGSMGHLLDAEEDGIDLSDFTVFEIEQLLNLSEKFALPVLLYLFRRIERSLHGQPTVILLEEAWIMLGHEVFKGKIQEWLRAFAKKNCAVVLATQMLTDAVNSGILDVIVGSTATKIFLPNVDARNEEQSSLYRSMGLNDRQIEIVAGAIPKRQYYYISEQGRRLYELALGPLALAFVGATDKESLAEIAALEARHGFDWIQHWLTPRGVRLADYLEVTA